MALTNLEKLSRLSVSKQGNLIGNLLIEPQPKISLNPDFSIFQFFPYEATFYDRELPFKQGDEIAFLNGYFPVCYSDDHNIPYYVTTQQFGTDVAIGVFGIQKANIILPIAREKIRIKYDKLYLTHVNGGMIALTQNEWTGVNFNEVLSTPYLIWQGRESDIDISGFESENSFRVGIFGTIPTTTSTMTLTVSQGYTAKNIEVTGSILNFVNPVQIDIYQEDQLSSSYLEQTWLPGASPYNNTFILPYRNGGRVTINVTGGGAGETALSVIALSVKYTE